MALQNDGLDDLYFMAQRAELARWVYTHFTGESELNRANFRAYEDDSLWELGKRDLAESLIIVFYVASPITDMSQKVYIKVFTNIL